MSNKNVSSKIAGYVVGSWSVDPAYSEIGFTVRKMKLSTVVGKFLRFTSQLVTAESPAESTVNVSVELDSVDTGIGRRDKHLCSDHFFSVEKNPVMVFRSTEIKFVGEQTTLVGNLTIGEVTSPVSLQFEVGDFVSDEFGEARVTFLATSEISRKDFNFGVNMPIGKGDFFIGDKIKIFVKVGFVLEK